MANALATIGTEAPWAELVVSNNQGRSRVCLATIWLGHRLAKIRANAFDAGSLIERFCDTYQATLLLQCPPLGLGRRLWRPPGLGPQGPSLVLGSQEARPSIFATHTRQHCYCSAPAGAGARALAPPQA